MPLSPRSVVAPLAVIALAFGGGWWAAREMPDPARSGPALAKSLSPAQSVPALAAENARLRAANRELEARLKTETVSPPATPATAALDPLRALEEATKRPGVTARVKLMTLEGRLDSGMASLFGLKPEEVQTLETAIVQAKRAVEQLIAANMTVEEIG